MKKTKKLYVAEADIFARRVQARAKLARNNGRDDKLIYSIGLEQRRGGFGRHSAFFFCFLLLFILELYFL